jgi:ATP-dependent Lhr-like helicase
LWGIDRICRTLRDRASLAPPGVTLLYVSPLKALNNDIERNLRVPLEGIRETARRMGQELPPLRVAVRTGDTPGHARAQMLKAPPHILITTPESLYLILTSPRGRDMLRAVQTVIIDEIHTLCGNKRGAHLALSLERLDHLAAAEGAGSKEQGTDFAGEAEERERGLSSAPSASPPARFAGVQRIGLSATQRPLHEVARFLGGQCRQTEAGMPPSSGELGAPAPRPVTIVDTGYQKALDLKVVTVVEDFANLPGDTIWPAVIGRLLNEIRRHRTTLVFANNRRLAERTADRLNAQWAGEESEEVPPGSTEILAPGGLARDRGMFALGADGPFRAHHGSISKESRRLLEQELKAGRLPALIGTSSLELGIDIGTVDHVAQLQSPKSVAQGLQRVGRSGHLVGQKSFGRIYATHREDLIEAAAIAHGMLNGEIEETYTPQNPLDVLAQQIVAMVAVESWDDAALFDLIRQAYPYRNLARRVFDSVLDMLSGRYFIESGDSPGSAAQQEPENRGQDLEGHALPDPVPALPGEVLPGRDGERETDAGRVPRPHALSALRARIGWDRAHGRLAALPGSRLLAISNAGTIPDTGAYGIYLTDNQTRIGEVDEEFVFETRPGDAFLFGSQVWRVKSITDDRLIVSPAPGAVPRMPFWHGDYPWRPYELGRRIGEFRRVLADRLQKIGSAEAENRQESAGLRVWLAGEYALDDNSIDNLVAHVRRQLDATGVISSDRRVVAELFSDAVGEPRLVLHSPFGGRVNGAWAIALRNALRERMGSEPEMMANDDGILVRFPLLAGPPPLEILTHMAPLEARGRILDELPNSAVFGAQFRMAAGRALLLPRAHGQKRTPFWLQRLKARDLLAIARRLGDFPIVTEAYRVCLQDVLDLPHLEEVLGAIGAGTIEVAVVHRAVPSPIASDLLFYFANTYVYEWDAPKAERDLQTLGLPGDVLDCVLAEREDLSDLLRPEAVSATVAEREHRSPGHRARSAEELAVILQELGDMTGEEISESCGVAGTGTDGQAEAALAPPRPVPWLAQLVEAGQALELFATGAGTSPAQPRLWVPAELAAKYRAAIGQPGPAGSHAERILARYLHHAGPVTRAQIVERYPFAGPWLDAALGHLVADHSIAKGRFTAGPGSAEQFCDRQLLDEFRRRTLALLRRAVQPVPAPAYASFLARWQYVAQDTQLTGVEGLRQVMAQLAGIALPLETWERQVLPARLPGFGAEDLAGLCLSGELVWSGVGSDARVPDGMVRDPGKMPRNPRIRFFRRGDGGFILAPGETAGPDGGAGLSAGARAVRDYLEREGASFFGELANGCGLPREALAEALGELVAAGLLTNDSLAALRALVARARSGPQNGVGPAPAEGGAAARGPAAKAFTRQASSLEADLARRRGGPHGLAARGHYHEARRRLNRQLAHSAWVPAGEARAALAEQASTGIDLSAGRWSLVQRSAVLGPELPPDERAARQARLLLERYGIVTRDCLAHEDGARSWPQLYQALQRLEMRGEVQRGYFVAGLAGAQFALPRAVESLRQASSGAEEKPIALSSLDPAMTIEGTAGPIPDALPAAPHGIPRFARLPSTDVVLWRGQIALLAEDHGARLSAPDEIPGDVLRQAIQAYLERPDGPRHLTVTQWNGAAPWGSPAESLLMALGFYRSPAGMEWWAK